MKIILTGATGLVGSAALRQCIASSAVSAVVVLSRKPVADELANSDKVTVILHDDFGAYPPELLDKLVGADACIWYVPLFVYFFLLLLPRDRAHLPRGYCLR